MATPAAVSLYRGAADRVAHAGDPVTVMFGPVVGGFIVNPATAEGQGIAAAEVLWVDIIDEATLGLNDTSFALQPGQRYTVVPGQTTNLSVTAATAGHKFASVVMQAPTPYPPTPQPGPWPPTGPTTVTEVIPSYLYEQYADDDDLRAFVDAYNGLAQQYVTWFAETVLGDYTSLSGALLDWVALGLYGIARPSLASGLNRDIGPLNTWTLNQIAFNTITRVGPQNVTVTTDDIFKRIITWNFYKGDGRQFNVRYLKRRVMRFLIGENGSAPNIEQTYLISVTFGADNTVSIRIAPGSAVVDGGAILNEFALNTMTYNQLDSHFIPSPDSFPMQKVFKEAVESGALQFPFQYNVLVAA